MADIVERLRAGTGGGKHWMELHEEAAAEIERLRLSLSEALAERDAAFEMSKCECGTDEACRNLVEARATGRREGMEERELCAIDLWNQLVVLSGYHITRPPTPDHEFVQVCNGDLRKMIELMGRPDNLDVDRFAARIAAKEKAE